MPENPDGLPIRSPQDTFASGLDICYEVLLYLSSRLARLKPGETLEFITRAEQADQAEQVEEKITSWCEAREYTLLASEPLPDGRRRFLIQK
jgi:TusA-related sulfurtransferase